MKTTARSSKYSRRHDSTSNHVQPPLLALPVELLNLVLGMLKPDDLRTLLQCSKAMAQQVLQHSTGRFDLQAQVQPEKKWAATRHLLQWAPPACVKLRIWHAKSPYAECDPKDILNFQQWQGCELPKASSYALDRIIGSQWQYMCLSELHLQGLALPWVVPPGLAHTCPNVHTLELSQCVMLVGSSSNRKGSGFSRGGADEAACWFAAPRVRQLKLVDITLPKLADSPDPVHLSAQTRPSLFAQQLQASLPGLRCLAYYHFMDSCMNLWKLWASQLTEVHCLPYREWQSPVSQFSTAAQLQKLYLPQTFVDGNDELLALLKMHLTHLEVEDFVDITQDLSDHACTWQYLRVCWQGVLRLSLLDLANVPLHSLTSPLVLGDGDDTDLPVPKDEFQVAVGLPRKADMHQLAKLQQVTAHLGQCGVKLRPAQIVYRALVKYDTAASDVDFAVSIAAVAAGFAALQQVQLMNCQVGQQVLQAVGAAHHHMLKCLVISECNTACFKTQPAWATLLSCLPALEKVELSQCWGDDESEHLDSMLAQQALPSLCAAMAQQPTGRNVEVWFHDDHTEAARDVFSAMMSGEVPIPEGVQVIGEDREFQGYRETLFDFVLTVVYTAMA